MNEVIASVVAVLLSVCALLLVSFWRRKSNRNAIFVNGLRQKFISQQKLFDAMLRTDRRHFVDGAVDPYVDTPLPIGFNATISAPDVVSLSSFTFFGDP